MAVVALKPKPKATFGDMLNQTAKASEPKAKKSSMPTLQAPPEVAEAVDTYQEAKTNWKQAEAQMNASAETIMAFVQERQDTDGFAGRYQGSYAVVGNRHQVKVIYANKYSLNSQDEGELAGLLGESFEALVEKKFSVKLRTEIFEDENLQAELMALVGERFADFFETTVSLGVVEGFSREIYRAVAPEQMEALRTFARQYKPSLR